MVSDLRPPPWRAVAHLGRAAVLVVPIRRATIEAESLDLVQVVDGGGVRYRIPLSADDDPVDEG